MDYKCLQFFPLHFLEVLYGLKAIQHHFFTTILQTDALNALRILFQTESILLHLLDLRGLVVFSFLSELINDDGVLVVVLYFWEGVKNKFVEVLFISFIQVDHDVVVIIVILGQFVVKVVLLVDEAINEVNQQVLLKRVQVHSPSVLESLLKVFFGVFVGLGGELVDLLVDIDERTILYLKVVVLQLTLNIFNQQFILLDPQFILEWAFLFIIDYWDQYLVDKAQVVETHQYVISLVYSLNEGVQIRFEVVLLLQ